MKKLIICTAVIFLLMSFMSISAYNPCTSYYACAEASLPYTPKASLKSGTYTVDSAKEVTLSCGTKNAVIYYSINNGKFKAYTKAISINENTVLSFYSEQNGKTSETITCSYKLKPKASLYSSGSNPIKISIKTALSGVKLYYTTDGSKPTTSSSEYTSDAIGIYKSCTLRVLAYKANCTANYFSKKISVKSSYSKSYLNDYTKKFYYTHLNTNEKKAYRAIYDAANTFKKKADLSGLNLSYDKVYNISQMVGFENPQLFWYDGRSYDADLLNNGNAESFYIMYLYSESEAEKITPKLIKKAEEIVKDGKKQGSEFFCVKYFHDYLVDNVEYTIINNDPFLGNHADSVILDSKGICSGYSRAMTYLCQTAGISCIGIVGETSEGTHMWNKVKLGKGWYNIDVTWDDAGNNLPCYYDYFCLTDNQMHKDHTPRKELPLSSAPANSTEFSYYNAMGITLYKSVNSAVKNGMKDVAEQYISGERTVNLYISPSLVSTLSQRLVSEFYTVINGYGAYPKEVYWDTYYDHLEFHFK